MCFIFHAGLCLVRAKRLDFGFVRQPDVERDIMGQFIFVHLVVLVMAQDFHPGHFLDGNIACGQIIAAAQQIQPLNIELADVAPHITDGAIFTHGYSRDSF